MLTLGAKIAVDTSELVTAERKMSGFADKFDRDFSKKINNLIGTGFLAGAGIGLITKILGRPSEIQDLANHYKLTTDEVQYLEIAAQQAGKTFSEFVSDAKGGAIELADTIKRIRDQGGIDIIRADEIEQMERGRKIIKQIQDETVKGFYRPIGGLMDASRSLFQGEFRQAGLQALTAISPMSLLGLTGVQDKARASLAASSPASSPQDTALSRRAKLQSDLEFEKAFLESDLEYAKALKSSGGGGLEAITGNLTARQQIGAYSAAPVTFIQKEEEQKDLLRNIEERLQEVKEAIKDL